MPPSVLLVIALAGTGWSCTENNGLWDCRPAQPQPRAAARPLASPVTAPRRMQSLDTPAPQAAEPPSVAETARESTITPAAPEAAPARVVEQPAPSAVAVAGPTGAFIVQVGAYRERAQAQETADRLPYDGLEVVPTEREGEVWYVLLLGAYSDIETARAAGAEYEASTGGSYWVRTAADLQSVAASKPKGA